MAEKELAVKKKGISSKGEELRAYWMFILPGFIMYFIVMAFPTVFSTQTFTTRSTLFSRRSDLVHAHPSRVQKESRRLGQPGRQATDCQLTLNIWPLFGEAFLHSFIEGSRIMG